MTRLGIFNGLSQNGQFTPAAQGLLATGLGILAHNRGLTSGTPALGLGGMMGLNAYQTAQQQQMQQQWQAAQLQQHTDAAKQRHDFANRLLQEPSQNTLGPSPYQRQAIAADLAFNQGKGVANLLKPDIGFIGGVAVDKNRVQSGFSVPTIAQNGQASQLIPDPNAPGGWRVQAPQGALQTYSQYRHADEMAKAGLDPMKVAGPGGHEYYVPRSTVATEGQSGALMASRNPADIQYETDTAKATAEQAKQIQSAGFNAGIKIDRYQQLGKLLKEAELSKKGFELAELVNQYGLLPTRLDKNIGNAQAAQAIANQMALELRDPSQGAGMPGALSDSDRQFLMSMVPNLQNTPEGRHQMIGMAVAIQQRQQQIAAMARQWQAKGGRLDRADKNGLTFFDYLQDWSSRHPLFGHRDNDAQ
ncbi:hypothetical protein KQH60_08065 [Mycetohabitans sp. B8]|uniref:hypothetical protein n=1 Tax=Mycetohabitans sp. B8 TaxID=2841845 RepID=UPI001F4480BE|nr:hypothetical protein [Mycetohabitans sp. B8]MCG1042501.1 hypothetical protein [Mycetohabitans sp. B8]